VTVIREEVTVLRIGPKIREEVTSTYPAHVAGVATHVELAEPWRDPGQRERAWASRNLAPHGWHLLDENRGESYASAVRLLSTQLAPGAM
jgi:hypothetical protein